MESNVELKRARIVLLFECSMLRYSDFEYNFVVTDNILDKNGQIRWNLGSLKFITVTVDDEARKNLKSLKNFPSSHNINIYGCKGIESLEGLPPNEISNMLDVSRTNIKNMIGCPRKLGHFEAKTCKNFTSLEGHPDEVYSFNVLGCINLPTVYKKENKWIHGPVLQSPKKK